MDKLTAEIIKTQMIGQTSGHMASIPNSPVIFSMFETFHNISMTSAGGMHSWDDSFKLFILELSNALNKKKGNTMTTKEEMLRDQRHESDMRNDIDYFCEHTLENLYLAPKSDMNGIFLFDVVDEIRKLCNLYEQDFNEFLDYLKEI